MELFTAHELNCKESTQLDDTLVGHARQRHDLISCGETGTVGAQSVRALAANTTENTMSQVAFTAQPHPDGRCGKQNLLLFIQPRWHPGTYFFNHCNVSFLMNYLHSPSKSDTDGTQILGFILICLSFTTGHFHTCTGTLQRLQLYYIPFLILGSVFTDFVVFCGDST